MPAYKYHARTGAVHSNSVSTYVRSMLSTCSVERVRSNYVGNCFIANGLPWLAAYMDHSLRLANAIGSSLLSWSMPYSLDTCQHAAWLG